MITELEVTKSIDINIYEDYDCGDHYKYETNASVDWNIQHIDIKDDIVRIRVERLYEDESASEVYDDEGEYLSGYILKLSEIFDIDISKDVILKALRMKDRVEARISNSTYISGEVLDYKYNDGKKLTKEEIEKYVLTGDNMNGESILVSVLEY